MNTRKEKKFNEILGQKKLKKKYMFKRDLKPSTINDSLILIKKVFYTYTFLYNLRKNEFYIFCRKMKT